MRKGIRGVLPGRFRGGTQCDPQEGFCDQGLRRLLSRGDILRFGYDHSTRVPEPWLGESTAREDGTAYGTLVTIIDQGEGMVTKIFHLVLEEDPECTGPGRIGSEEHARRAVRGARYMGLGSDANWMAARRD